MFDFKSAKKRVDEAINPTHMFYSEIFSDLSKNNVYIKPENLQKTGSFKLRGAYNKISKMDEESKSVGIVTASAGNHAQGVAFSANHQGIKAIVCMPETTPMIKVDGTLKYGAEVDLHGQTFDETNTYAQELAKEKGYTFIPPYDDEDVIEGQGTIALEILESLQEADYILVPIGGGGLVSGIAKCAKEMKPEIKIVGVEPANAASMQAAMEKGGPITLDSADTIADGTAVARVGDITYEICKENVDEYISVTEEEIMVALTTLMEKHKLVAEPSGALSLAASKKLGCKNKNVVCVISGGNIDMSFISQLIIARFTVELQNAPGKLRDLLDVIAYTKANIVEVLHDSLAATSRYKNIQVEITLETNGKDHIRKIKDILTEKGYNIH
ncbi:threonine ammonia-lyase [Anaerococcus vaginalis]|uniref:threonine ammonia-lyase n=1 Tax=Anaerococcus vaginalis TaxID=33037 RepID=UPI002910D0DB|nr:threonine ammonia-lyase [Anaerococcus vaginalis]MDU5461572.1 threonine ammonia-lyase [Anaerococcus vaginalis]